MRWALWGLFFFLPLQWFVLPGIPYGQGRLHLVAMGLFLGFMLVRHRARAFRPTIQTALPFILAELALLMVWTAAGLYHGTKPIGPFQDFVYMSVFVAVGTAVYRAARDLEPGSIEALRWVALVASVSLVLGLSIAMAINGVNPATVFGQTIATANPEILQKELFRSAFGGFGYSTNAVQGNLRHEVFAAVLAAMFVASWAVRLRPFVTRRQTMLFRFSMALGTLLLLVSLSRSVLLAAAVWPLLSLLRSVATARLSGRQVAVAIFAVGAISFGLVSGFANVLWVRFTADTSSYTARDSLLQLGVANIRAHYLTGGVDTVGASSHNFILDSWLRAGIFAALAAAVMTILIFGLGISLLIRIAAEPSWILPVAASLALPLVRIFTAGGGVIPPVEWVVLGFVAGAMAFEAGRRREGAASLEKGPAIEDARPSTVASG